MKIFKALTLLLLCFQLANSQTIVEVTTPDIRFCAINNCELEVQNSSSSSVTFTLEIDLDAYPYPSAPSGKVKFDTPASFFLTCAGLGIPSFNPARTIATVSINLAPTSTCTLSYRVIPTTLAISSPNNLRNTYEINTVNVSASEIFYNALFPTNQIICSNPIANDAHFIGEIFMRELQFTNTSASEIMDKPIKFTDTRSSLDNPTCIQVTGVNYWDNTSSSWLPLSMTINPSPNNQNFNDFTLTAADISTIATAEQLSGNVFGPASSIRLQLVYEVTCCFTSLITSSFMATWACNVSDPAIYQYGPVSNFPSSCNSNTSLTLQTNPVFGIPDLDVTSSSIDNNFCYGIDHTADATVTITNNGTGQASNIAFNIDQGSNSFTHIIESFQISYNGGPASSITPTFQSAAYSNACDAPGTHHTRMEFAIQALNAGEYATLTWQDRTCAPAATCPSGSRLKDSWGYKLSFEDDCGTTYPPSANYSNLFNVQNLGSMVTEYNGLSDIDDNVVNTASIDLSSVAGLWPAADESTNNRRLAVEITLTNDLIFEPACPISNSTGTIQLYLFPNSVFNNSNICVTASPYSPSSVTVVFPSPPPCSTGTSKTIRAEFEIDNFGTCSFGNTLNGLHNAKLTFTYKGLCGQPFPLSMDHITVHVFFVPDQSCTNPADLLVGCTNADVGLHCPGCIRKGLHSLGYSIQRGPNSYGWQDCDNDNWWDPDNSSGNVPKVIDAVYRAAHPFIKTKRAMVGDLIEGVLTTKVENNSNYGPVNTSLTFTHAYWKSEFSQGDGNLTPVECEIVFTHPTDPIFSPGPVTIIIPATDFNPQSSSPAITYNIDFSISRCSTLFNPALNPGYSSFPITDFIDKLEIKLIHRFRVTGNVGTTNLPCNVTNTAYLGLTAESAGFNFLDDPDSPTNQVPAITTPPDPHPLDYDAYCANPNGFPPCTDLQWYCTHYNGTFTLIGYVFLPWSVSSGSGTYDVACGHPSVSMDSRIMVGEPGALLTGRNPFPYEYRQWVNYHQLVYGIPSGYVPLGWVYPGPDWNSGRAWYHQFYNSTGPTSVLGVPLVVVSSTTATINFDATNYQPGSDDNGPCGILSNGTAQILRPDDDFFNQVKYQFSPGCDAPASTTSTFYQEMDFIPSGLPAAQGGPMGITANIDFATDNPQITPSGTTWSGTRNLTYNFVNNRPLLQVTGVPTPPAHFTAYHQQECMTFNVENTNSGPNADATHAWVAFNVPSSPQCVTITSIEVDNVVYPNPTANQLYYFSGVFENSQSRQVTICFTYDCTVNCNANRYINILTGWDCRRSDESVPPILTANDYTTVTTCTPTTRQVLIDGADAQFQASLTCLTPHPAVCSSVDYELQVSSTSFGALNSIVVTVTLPCSTMVYNSTAGSSFIFNGNTDTGPNAQPVVTPGVPQILTWAINNANTYIAQNGLEGLLYPSVGNKYFFKIRFSVNTGCALCYQNRSTVQVDYNTNCNVPGLWTRNFNPLLEQGSPFNDLSVTLGSGSYDFCANAIPVTVTLTNNNSNTLQNNNFLEVTIPTGYTADGFSITPTLIFGQMIRWNLTSLSAITFNAHPDDCGPENIIANIYARGEYACTPTSCHIDELESTFTLPVTPTAPSINITNCPSQALLCNDQPYQFNSDATCGFYSWDFGDGSPLATIAAPSHVYTSAGSYTVTLTVSGNASGGGCTSTATCVVTVDCPDKNCGYFCTYENTLYCHGTPCTSNSNFSINQYATWWLMTAPHFQNAFPAPNYLVIGCPTHHITFNNATSVRCFLKNCGSPSITTCVPLFFPTYLNPSCTSCPSACCTNSAVSNSLVREVTTLSLTVNFDLADDNFNPLTLYHFAFLHLTGVPITDFFYNWQVSDILTYSNDYIGSCSPLPIGYSQVNFKNLIQAINGSHNNCADNGNQNGHPHLFDCDDGNRSLSAQINPEDGSCLNDNTAMMTAWAVGGTPPFSYLWSNGSSSYFIDNLADGKYTVTITDANNETATAESFVKSSSNICCNVSGNPFPRFPDNTNVLPSTGYDVNFLPAETVDFEESMTLSGNTLNIMEGVQFVVKDGTTLELDNCVLSACGSMWKGIVVESGGVLILKNSTIKDAERGIYGEDGSKIYVYTSQFENNVVGIETPVNSGGTFNSIDFVIAGITFDFSGALHDAYPGQVPFGTKPKAGIIFNNMIGAIGDDGYPENTFSDMNCGIISYASVLKVTNSKFLEIHNEYFYSGQFMGSGIAAIGGDKGSYSIEVYPYLLQNPTSPTFKLCDYGVYGDNNINVTVTGCSMYSMNHGIYIQKCQLSNQVVLKENDISATNMGIQFYANEGADLLYAGYNNVETTDLKGECIIAYESGSGKNHLVVEENTLSCNGSSYGIDLIGCYSSTVYHNTIDEVTTAIKNFTGISISACNEPNVSCNIINGLTTTDQFLTYGIKVNVTDNAILHCNSTNLTTYGIAFQGPCVTVDNVKDNEMNEHYEGLHLNSNAIIGKQNNGGNRWIGPFSSGYGANNLNYAGGISVTASLFIVHQSPVTDFNPSIPAYDVTWFQVDPAGVPYSCTSRNECPEKSSEKSMVMNPEVLDYSIANDDSLSVDFIPETKSMGRQFLYKKLTDVPALLDSSSDLNDFYSAYSSSSVQSLQVVRDGLLDFTDYGMNLSDSCNIIDSTMIIISDSIAVLDSLMSSDTINAPAYVAQKMSLRSQANTLQASMNAIRVQMKSVLEGKISTTDAINTSVSSAQLPESNEQIVNDIYLQTVALGNYAFSSSQVSSVLEIAQQCPYAGGKAVYRARSLYRFIDETIEYDDDSTCLVFGIYRRGSNQPSSEIETGNILLIPNPANNLVTVVYQSASEGSCDLYVTDITGNVIKQIDIPCDKTRFEFSVEDIKNGLYLVDVRNEGQSIGRSKLAIIK